MSTEPTPQRSKLHSVKIIREFITDQVGSKQVGRPPEFQKFSNNVSRKAGSPYALIIAILLISIWAVSGPLFDFSDTWQLVINTTTTIVTFLMVFAIQNTQNRDSRAMQLKLDELIKATRSARMEFVDIEELSDKELEGLHTEFKELHEKIQERRKD